MNMNEMSRISTISLPNPAEKDQRVINKKIIEVLGQIFKRDEDKEKRLRAIEDRKYPFITRDILDSLIFSGQPYQLIRNSPSGSFEDSRIRDNGTVVRVGGVANNSTFENDGTLVFNGDATVWDDLRIIPGAFEFAGSSDPTLSNWTLGGTTFKVYQFNTNNEVFFTCQIPHSYVQGTNIFAHVHWTPHTRGVAENGNTVAWTLDYSWANTDAVFGNAATVNLTDTCTGVNNSHLMTPQGQIIGTGREISSMLVCRLYRAAGDTWATNTLNNRPALLEFDLHFQIDTIGSREALIK